MSAIVVTGGLGRIGRNLAVQLRAAGHDVVAVGNLGSGPAVQAWLRERDVRVHLADCLGDPSTCAGLFRDAEAVVHLACSSNPTISESDPWFDIERNLKGTSQLFELAERNGVEQFLFASSGGTVYGAVTQFPTPETTVPAPIGLHGAMKLACEQYLGALARRGRMRLKILRIANPYGMPVGVRLQGFIDVAIANLHAGRPVMIWGDGHVRRDYLHVDDLVAACVAALQVDAGFVLNVGSGIDHSLHDILAELKAHFDLTDRVVFEPSRAVDLPISVLDITRARAVLGWSPSIALSDGIARTIDAY